MKITETTVKIVNQTSHDAGILDPVDSSCIGDFYGRHAPDNARAVAVYPKVIAAARRLVNVFPCTNHMAVGICDFCNLRDALALIDGTATAEVATPAPATVYPAQRFIELQVQINTDLWQAIDAIKQRLLDLESAAKPCNVRDGVTYEVDDAIHFGNTFRATNIQKSLFTWGSLEVWCDDPDDPSQVFDWRPCTPEQITAILASPCGAPFPATSPADQLAAVTAKAMDIVNGGGKP